MSKARVVSLEICRDGACKCSDLLKSHLRITTHYVDIQRGAAIAISYAWGEFARKKRCIGHFGKSGTEAYMELGMEWDLDDLITTLVSDRVHVDPLANSSSREICYWIDQLCIKQDDPEEVRATLASIPQIFRSFDVAILIPGQPCLCWSKRLELTEERSRKDQDAKPHVYVSLNQAECPNLVGIYGWITRIWTRQEMEYAEHCRMIWTSEIFKNCGDLDRNGENIEGEWVVRDFDTQAFSNTTRYRWETCTSRFRNNIQSASTKFRGLIRISGRQLLFAINSWRAFHQENSLLNPEVEHQMAWKLLLGYALHAQGCVENNFIKETWIVPHRSQYPNSMVLALTKFIISLQKAFYTVRFASKQYDYVISIWVDCPKYVIPDDYKTFSAGQMLYDALEQLDKNFGIRFTTYLPDGLFSAVPAYDSMTRNNYLRQADCYSLADAYGTLPEGSEEMSQMGKIRPREGLETGVLGMAGPELFASHVRFIKRSVEIGAGMMGCTVAKFLLMILKAASPAHIRRLLKRTDQERSQREQIVLDIIDIGLAHETESWLPQLPASVQAQINQGVFDADELAETILSNVFNKYELESAAFTLACVGLGFEPSAAVNNGLSLIVDVVTPMIGLSSISDLSDENARAVSQYTTTKHYGCYAAAYEMFYAPGVQNRSKPELLLGVWLPSTWEGVRAARTKRMERTNKELLLARNNLEALEKEAAPLHSDVLSVRGIVRDDEPQEQVAHRTQIRTKKEEQTAELENVKRKLEEHQAELMSTAVKTRSSFGSFDLKPEWMKQASRLFRRIHRA